MCSSLTCQVNDSSCKCFETGGQQYIFWSNAMIILSSFQHQPCHLEIFVANYIRTIQELSDVHQWRYVPSTENPADLISRGLDASALLRSDLWINGPDFLKSNDYPQGPIPAEVKGKDYDSELKKLNDKLCMNITKNYFIDDLLHLTNNFTKLTRIISYIYRFYKNCRSREKTIGPIISKELEEAELTLVKLVQREEFSKDIKCLQGKGEVPPESKLKNLYPFLDDNGVLRVGGRLSNSQLEFNRKFPAILPKNHHLTSLIGETYHRKYLHIGPQGLLFMMRQKFWPLNGRNLCRKLVHNCVTCFKAKPVPCHQLMGNLPPERITPNLPFNCVGVDFFGHFMIKYPNQRKGKLNKIYVCIFICLVTKACHLELVTNLSSDAFIATLKRFISRRGKCSHIFSDNAKNFVGSYAELRKLKELVNKPDEKLTTFLANEQINWSFIPPRAPNHGGLWEAGVKSVKYHLKRVVGNLKLTYEEFWTIIVQIEAILNSRPLHPMSSDLDDFDVLTPAHFLIGRPLTSIVEPDLSHVSNNRLKLWHRITKLNQIIWKKWKNNYLSTLQERTKWCWEKENVKVGTMVILKEDNLPICNWSVGRIVELFPGKDNKVRVIGVKTKKGIFKRPITKICILPIAENG